MKKTIFVLTLLCCVFVWGQKGVKSPYSFYGLGQTRFGGNTENVLMGGISAYADSIRADVRNPASLGKLQFTSYALSASTLLNRLKDEKISSSNQVSTIDYLLLSFPVYKKIGVSVGLIPYSSVGYNFTTKTANEASTFEGKGGINRFLIASGWEFLKGYRIGISGYYNFGEIESTHSYVQKNIMYPFKEENSSSYSGFSWSFAVQHQRKISKKINLLTGVSYTPKTVLSTENQRIISTLSPSTGGYIVKETKIVNLQNMQKQAVNIPSELTLAAGLGEEKKWFAGIDYQIINRNQYHNSFITSGFVTYTQANKWSLGGFYIPNYNSYTNYWKRITYRAGIYYENSGMQLKNNSIDEFGISFGVTLPVKDFSKITIGGIYSSRGAVKAGLVKENTFGVKVALTLNDKWFQRSKYN